MNRILIMLFFCWALIAGNASVSATDYPWLKEKATQPSTTNPPPTELPQEKDTGIKEEMSAGQQSKQKDSKEKIITYTDKENGFSIMHPERWKPVDTSDSHLYKVDSKGDGDCVFYVDHLNSDDVDGYFERLTNSLSESFKITSRNIYSQKIASLNARILELEMTSSLRWHWLSAVVSRNGLTYHLKGMCRSDIENSKKLLLDTIVSFRLLK